MSPARQQSGPVRVAPPARSNEVVRNGEVLAENDEYGPIPGSGAGLLARPELSKTSLIVKDAAGDMLYCVMGNYAVTRGKRTTYHWVKERYVSATCAAAAITHFQQIYWYIPRFREVMASPAIGFFVHDNHGDKLSAGGARPVADPADEFATP